MAFVAGYVSNERQYTTAELVERLGSFSILPGEAAACEQRVVEIPHGHLLIKHRMTYPIPPRLVVDERGSTLATLGFLDADPKDALTACVGSDARSLDDCEGEFIAAFADVASGTLHVVNDRFAARPCYILRTAHAVYFSSNVAWLFVLARQPYRPDLVGWLEAFSYAHTNGARTTADGVFRTHFAATHHHVSKDLMRNVRNRDQRQRELIAAALNAPPWLLSDGRTAAGSSATTSTRAFTSASNAMRPGAVGSASPRRRRLCRGETARGRVIRGRLRLSLPSPPGRPVGLRDHRLARTEICLFLTPW